MRRGVFRLSRRFLPVQLYSAIAGTHPRANIPPYYAGCILTGHSQCLIIGPIWKQQTQAKTTQGRSTGV